ncbi:MAG: hypothetical protein KKE89_10125 [Actinobacteria bacterium]|nr:hypothetical protein [Actinomycetota bacterium]
MTRRLLFALIALALVFSACAYESAGTTTTSIIDPADVAPPTGPADIVFRDQMTDGAGVVVDSVTLPSPGFVVLYGDEGGSPGAVIGATQIISAGVIANVPVSFFVPIEANTVVHAQVHVDIDRDEAFTYEPPDAFIDLPGTLANGEVAAAEATVTLLAPISPAAVTFAEQRTLGQVVEVLAVELPSPGFVVIREDDFGEAGRILGTSDLLPAGTSSDVPVTLNRALTISAVLYASLYIDRDGDGSLALGPDEVDQIAQGPDGMVATVGVPITVVPLAPTELAAVDQESEGAEVVAIATVPAPGFLVLRADDGGAPGAVLAVSSLLALGSTDVTLTLDPAIEADTTFWLTIFIDFNGDGEFDDSDPVGITGGGESAETSILVTLPVPEEPADGS